MPASIAFTIEDAKGLQSTTFINVPTATTAAAGITFAQAVAALIDVIVGGKIVNIGLCYRVALPGGLKASADADSDVEEGARFGFLTSANHPTSLRLPTFLETLFLAGTKQVDVADTDVDAFVDAMIAGVTVVPVDSRDEDIVSLSSAKEQFLKDRGAS